MIKIYSSCVCSSLEFTWHNIYSSTSEILSAKLTIYSSFVTFMLQYFWHYIQYISEIVSWSRNL
jgi:hypothetical protein